MIEQRIGESVGLDGGALAYERFMAGGDQATGMIFDFINADEVTHVFLGNAGCVSCCRPMRSGNDSRARCASD